MSSESFATSEPRPREAGSSASWLARTHLELVVQRLRRAVLSIPALDREAPGLSSKDLLATGEVAAEEKFALRAHLERAVSTGQIAGDRPILALGLRNSLVNARSIVVRDGQAFAADRERPFQSQRPYYGILYAAGRFSLASYTGADLASLGSNELFCSGIPVVWDGLTEKEIQDLFLLEAADHSHIFDLPRGNHPGATEESRTRWLVLHEVFMAHLASDTGSALRAMQEAVRQLIGLRRSSTYLHSVLGTDEAGRLVNVVAQGRLEEVGRIAAGLGCRRAICVENSGSVMPTFLPQGLAGEEIPLLRAPNYRPLGRALLLLEMEDETFGPLTGRREATP